MGLMGPAGPTGPTGPTGPQGVAGPAGVFGASIINPATPNTFRVSLNGETVNTTNSAQFTGVAMPVNCTFDRLVVSTYGASGGSDTFTVNLVVNGVDQTQSCSVTSVTGAIQSCSDTAHPISVTVGQIVGLKIVQASGTPIVRVNVGTRCN